MARSQSEAITTQDTLSTYVTPLGAWAFALGNAVGWGSLVITANTYLVQAGPRGSTLGMLVGMVIMLVIARNYHYMIRRHSSADGAYAYARDVFGFDHGVLIGWFLALTYIAMFWANATSLPLFARYFVGDAFRFGFSYQIFGYEVYLGEALLSVVAILLSGLFCVSFRRGVQSTLIALAITFVVGIALCFGASLAGHGATSFAFEPAFVPDVNRFSQVMRIACISPWAFVGFENISHLSEEFSFSRAKSFRVLTVSLVTITALYVCIILLSTMAYPAGCESWLAYLSDLGSYAGIDGLPTFFVAQYYMGSVGVVVLMLSLLALIVSSLFANLVALSRLFFALAQDEVLPIRLSELNGKRLPWRSIRLVIALSCAIPFLGRTAIGWIVDVTTLGATIVYGFVSACAMKDARASHDTVEWFTGLVGTVVMVGFGVMLLLPSLTASASMATESYFLFTVWSVVGFIFFRHLLQVDHERRFGKSIVAWLVLLSLILFTSLAWFGQITSSATGAVMQRVQDYYNGRGAAADLALSETSFMEHVMGWLGSRITQGITLVGALFMFSLAIMLSNFSIMRKREDESERKAAAASTMANRDQLTGVKNKRAYAAREEQLDEQIASGTIGNLAVVVCDVNGLKQVNDTLGHKAGDEFIRAACAMVCRLFNHSPVFRVGGDEFAVILQGSDFDRRNEIMAELEELNREHIESGDVVVSAGLSELVAGQDRSLRAVFERADALMYARKKELRQAQGLPER